MDILNAVKKYLFFVVSLLVMVGFALAGWLFVSSLDASNQQKIDEAKKVVAALSNVNKDKTPRIGADWEKAILERRKGFEERYAGVANMLGRALSGNDQWKVDDPKPTQLTNDIREKAHLMPPPPAMTPEEAAEFATASATAFLDAYPKYFNSLVDPTRMSFVLGSGGEGSGRDMVPEWTFDPEMTTPEDDRHQAVLELVICDKFFDILRSLAQDVIRLDYLNLRTSLEAAPAPAPAAAAAAPAEGEAAPPAAPAPMGRPTPGRRGTPPGGGGVATGGGATRPVTRPPSGDRVTGQGVRYLAGARIVPANPFQSQMAAWTAIPLAKDRLAKIEAEVAKAKPMVFQEMELDFAIQVRFEKVEQVIDALLHDAVPHQSSLMMCIEDVKVQRMVSPFSDDDPNMAPAEGIVRLYVKARIYRLLDEWALTQVLAAKAAPAAAAPAAPAAGPAGLPN